MKIIIFGGAGFIGTNLALELSKSKKNTITLVDKKLDYFHPDLRGIKNIEFVQSNFNLDTDFKSLLQGHEIVYHLVSTTVPTTSNQQISEELTDNVIVTSKLLDACVDMRIKKIVFLSSGGTVYGRESSSPLKEDDLTYPINSYGIQKITIEKLLYLYNYLYNLDYRVIRLSNPYGPYQRVNGILGVITTFSYKALKNEVIQVYGDGTVIRDFIYIDDAIKGIINISNYNGKYKIFNLGSGKGTSINDILDVLRMYFKEIHIEYMPSRKSDVPCNYLDISRYQESFGHVNFLDVESGILKTIEFLKKR